MPSTGNLFPGTGADDASIGATAWTSPGNILSDNAVLASINAPASSHYLVAKNFNFSAVPANAVIVGVTVRIEAAETSAGAETLNARLQDAAGALLGTGKTASISGTGMTVYTYGGIADLWGASITVAMVKDADFGVRFWFTTAHAMTVDYVTIALEYTIPGPGRADTTSTAFALGSFKTQSVGRSDTVSTALALIVEKSAVVGQADTVSTAFALAVVQGGGSIPVGQADTVSTAFALAAEKSVAVGRADTLSTAFALGSEKTTAVGRADTLSTAFALAAEESQPVGRADTLSTAFALGSEKSSTVGRADTLSTAFALGVVGGALPPAPAAGTITILGSGSCCGRIRL